MGHGRTSRAITTSENQKVAIITVRTIITTTVVIVVVTKVILIMIASTRPNRRKWGAKIPSEASAEGARSFVSALCAPAVLQFIVFLSIMF